jgi:predicted kinase
VLIIFSGLPGVGKTTIARELARQIGAVHVRIDSVEQALRASGAVKEPIDDSGYRVGYAIAEDNLRIGRTVIADSVNPLNVTRDAWVEIADRLQVIPVEIEITCDDLNEHRRRVETRTPDIAGFRLPTWDDAASREYQPWNRKHIVIDTSSRTFNQSVDVLRELLAEK